MDHKAANHFALNIVVYNDVPNPLTQNFTIKLDVHEELFESNGKVYIIDTIQERVKDGEVKQPEIVIDLTIQPTST